MILGNLKKASLFLCAIAFLVLFGSLGCAAKRQSRVEDQKSIPEHSKFRKIQVGMSYRQVENLIGIGSDYDVNVTGKAYNPFYFGTDNTHTVWYYKGEGRIEVDNDNIVVEVEYDPEEDGYK